jgi:hypothetical protein
MGTRLYTVHYREEAKGSLPALADEAVLVKVGFSWPAFLVPFVWLIWKRMWIVLAFYLVAEAALIGLAVRPVLPDNALLVLSFALHLLLGLQGNDLYRWTLDRRRYRERGAVAAEDAAAAERRYFAGLAGAPAP